MQLAPRTFDLSAHYEPSAGFSVSPRIRRSLDELSISHHRRTLMTGRHSGRPVLHTDIKGISVGTRIEVSRLVFRPAAQPQVLSEAFRLFHDAPQRGVTSGPISRIIINFPKADRRREPRAAAQQAFREVFESECCFLSTYHTTRHKHLEIGRAVVHQTLLQHLWESGPYHSSHLPRVEAVVNELKSQSGRYENHRFFVEPFDRPGKVPNLRFCYSGDQPDNLVEVAMRQKTEEHLVYVDPAELVAGAENYVSLSDYERASRRFGTLWVMQDDLVRALERQPASAFFLFMEDENSFEPDRWFSWQQLHDRQRDCPRIGRALRNSPSFLDMSLHQLTKSEFLDHEKDRYRLHPRLAHFQHVTFYNLGLFHKRLD